MRIALLTPYSGNNLGDAAIQDAMITNLRLRIPDAQFSGISLNCDNFLARHGEHAFPLCATDRSFFGMSRGQAAVENDKAKRASASQRQGGVLFYLKQAATALRHIPVLRPCLKMLRNTVSSALQEVRHSVGAYRFLQTHDLLIVSGGGQLDDEWGGSWGHPFSLFKWTMLARVRRIPCAIVSVGAGKISSATSSFFFSTLLGVAQYRSFRDKNSRKIASDLLSKAAADPVVPDLAFSLPPSELPGAADIRSLAHGRTIVAVSPIAFAKPAVWPSSDRELYNRYLQQMAHAISQLIAQDNFLVMVWSALSDRKVIDDILQRLDADAKNKLNEQMHIPEISSWKDLIAVLRDVDFLVTSRLHSTILGFVAARPTIAISFDRKVDWVMSDLGQTDYLLQIRNFVAEDVLGAFERLKSCEQSVTDKIRSYHQQAILESAVQYDTLVSLTNVA